jgi:hypothetical protein
MQDKALIKLLESMKDDSAMGGSFHFQSSWERVAKDGGFTSNIEPAQYGFRDYLEFYVHQFTHAMLKPAAGIVAVFLFAITGWVSAANISENTLPGDDLYPVKLAVERAQLSLAFDAEQHASLQVEFASRRLLEMVEVAATHTGENSSVIEGAVERARSQVASIQEDLGGASSTELAKAVGRNTAIYQSAVSTTSELPEAVQEEVEAVKEIIKETEEQAVEVVITAHELGQDEEAARELASTLLNELNRIELAYGDDALEVIETARTLQEEGAYRRAFQVLKEFELAQ